ncbi:unnamed protein product [Meganyctiphanes norvegica]|uniref:Major facilitator superfamily (MFS) profile domain-containing protein n=1 Tax=Meganyctiphanes norvegica TaxID=48144 RepID=A0AAV2QR02_MEGNR
MAWYSKISDRYNQRQWMTLVVLALCNFCSCTYTSLLAPLYPPLATEKGLHPTFFGFVFGAFSFSAMLCSFLCGKFINNIGPKFMFGMSIFIMAVADIALGLLVYIEDILIFFGVSLTLRVVSSFGTGAMLTARNTIIAKEFLDNAGFTFAILEICIGLGMMVGPTVGGALMEYGGFPLPFIVLGFIEFLSGIVSVMLLPTHDFVIEEDQSDSNFTHLLLNPKITYFCLAVFSASLSRGFYEVALENHLHLLGLTPVMIGSMFMLRGGTFTLSSPMFGFLCDKVMSPTYVVLVAASCGCIGFLLLGPVPFIPLTPTVTLCIIALSSLGIGGCGELVGGYTGSIRAALEDGLPDNIVTYGLVSGLWSTAYFLGDFLGPTITGFMIDNVGFGWSSTVILSLHSLVVLNIIIYLFLTLTCKIGNKNEGYGNVHKTYPKIENYDAGTSTAQLII